MTAVATTLRSAYLAGPMRGIEEYNFPAFREATQWLRDQGWDVFSPAERDENDPNIDHTENVAGWEGSRGLDYFMAYDLKAVCETDCVICLPGWEESQGARLETVTAVEIEHPVFVIEYDDPHGTRVLRSVDPEYIQKVFAARGVLVEGHLVEWTDTVREIRLYDREKVTLSALPTGSAERKAVPLARGVLDYFPAALAEVARVSKAGNDKHNPGQEMHHARGKSTDHADCLLRHLVDRGKLDPETGQRHSAEVAWRALALLQQELEDEGLAPMPRGAREA